MKTFLAVLFASLWVTPIFAGPFGIVRYECANMSAERDGIKCAVAPRFVTNQPTLLIRVLGGTADPEERKNRITYMIARTIRSFFLDGGKYVAMRAVNPAGVLVERICHKLKRGLSSDCLDWQPVEGGDLVKWP